MNALPLILVVDDEERIRRLLSGAIEDQDDMRVVSAASAEEALALLRGEPADVAVVDLRLPGMDGEAFIAQAHREGLCRRFVLHSGSIDLALTPAMEEAGMGPEDVLQKPVGVDVVLSRVRDLMRQP